jgi:hypothetical protein
MMELNPQVLSESVMVSGFFAYFSLFRVPFHGGKKNTTGYKDMLQEI